MGDTQPLEVGVYLGSVVYSPCVTSDTTLCLDVVGLFVFVPPKHTYTLIKLWKLNSLKLLSGDLTAFPI